MTQFCFGSTAAITHHMTPIIRHPLNFSFLTKCLYPNKLPFLIKCLSPLWIFPPLIPPLKILNYTHYLFLFTFDQPNTKNFLNTCVLPKWKFNGAGGNIHLEGFPLLQLTRQWGLLKSRTMSASWLMWIYC